MSSPRDIHMPLPTDGRIPRVGKLRLGVKTTGTRQDGSEYERPKSTEHFVVNEDESTSRQAAESFHAKYGDAPRELEVVLPAPRVDDVFEGAYRSYGSGLLKRKCTGPGGECVTRDKAGDWVASPCMCEKEGLDPNDKDNHCQRRWTLTVMLMDVAGVGVWQLDTGSSQAAEGIVQSLRLIEQFRGHLQGARATLRIVKRVGAPKGHTRTYNIVELGATDLTPAQALAQASEAAQRVELPASTLDEEPDVLLENPGTTAKPRTRITGDIPTPPLPEPEEDIEGEVMPYALEPLRAQLTHLSRQEKADLWNYAGLAAGTRMPDVKARLIAYADELGVDYTEEPDARAILLVARMAEHAALPDDSAEAFQHFADTGQDLHEDPQARIA